MLWYTCYDPDSDEILAIGSLRSCAHTLGITASSFYSYLSNARSGRYCPYTVVIENTRTGKFMTLHGSSEKEASL